MTHDHRVASVFRRPAAAPGALFHGGQSSGNSQAPDGAGRAVLSLSQCHREGEEGLRVNVRVLLQQGTTDDDLQVQAHKHTGCVRLKGPGLLVGGGRLIRSGCACSLNQAHG